jgi:hypothetical protein
MSLGGRFPPEFLERHLRRRLAPGVVFKVRALMDDQQVREKRFLAIAVDDQTVACVINSVVNPFIEARPALRRCQVLITAADHPFMQHDSYIDCRKVFRIPTNQVVAELLANSEWMLGTIHHQLREQVLAALKGSPMMRPADVATLCAELEGAHLD